MPNSKPLKLIAANETFGALQALIEVLEGKQALFVAPPEVNGLMPEVHGLSNTVSNDTAVIVETSGSTGLPKRISLSREALLASANASQLALGGSGQWLLALPINYVAGINVLVRSIVADTQPVLMNTSLPFTAEAFSRATSMLGDGRKFTSLVPTQLLRLFQASEDDEYLLSQLRSFDAILLGGQTPNRDVLEALRDKGVNIVETYGMTETAGGCVYDGTPLAGVHLRINHSGIIEIQSPTLANSVAHADGWFQTNDLGQIDAAGHLTVLGRADRVIVSGGIKVSLDRVEAVIGAIGGVNEVVAISLPSLEWGERVAIVYTGSPEIAEYIAGEGLHALGTAAKPLRVIRVEQLPKLPNGKPDYQTLRHYFL